MNHHALKPNLWHIFFMMMFKKFPEDNEEEKPLKHASKWSF